MIKVEDRGSVVLLTPTTDEAREWMDEHVEINQTWGKDSVVVEPRYVAAILEGALEAGLEVE